MEWQLTLVISFVVLLLVMGTSLPISFSLAVLGIVAILIFWPSGLRAIGPVLVRANLNFALICIPLFIFMGDVLMFSGFARDFFDTIEKWFGAIPGSLSAGSIAMSTLFAALTGSTTACTAVVGSISVPEMLKRRYHKPLALGVATTGGSLGILIPPSLAFILFGVSGQQNVARLFLGGLIPGLIIAALMLIYVVVQCSRHPDWAPREAAASWREKFASLRRTWGIILLVAMVLGTIYTGIATATEAAALGCLGSLIIGFVYRTLNWANLRKAILSTISITSMVIFIYMGGLLFSKILSTLGMAEQMTAYLTGGSISPWGVMIGLQIFFLILGCLMDPAAIILVFSPLAVPIVVGLGFDPIWFGVVFVINIAIGCITPPVGYNLYVMKGLVPEASMSEIVGGSLPLLSFYVAAMALVMAFPQLALWLPSMMMG